LTHTAQFFSLLLAINFIDLKQKSKVAAGFC
jgi:hypothetical protein